MKKKLLVNLTAASFALIVSATIVSVNSANKARRALVADSLSSATIEFYNGKTSYLDPEKYEIIPGETFTVRVTASSTKEDAYWKSADINVYLGTNADYISFVSLDVVNDLDVDGSSISDTSSTGLMNSSVGKYYRVGISFDADYEYASTNDIVFDVTFKLSESASEIYDENIGLYLYPSGNKFVYQDGSLERTTQIKSSNVQTRQLVSSVGHEKNTITYRPGTNGTGEEVVDVKVKDSETFTEAGYEQYQTKGAIYTRDGYTQIGWSTTENATVAEVGLLENYNGNDDVVLYPVWEANTYNIIYELDGGTNSNSNPATRTTDKAITLVAPTKPGYDFVGWYTDDEELVTKNYTIPAGTVGDVTVHAKWELHEYKVTVYYRFLEDPSTYSSYTIEEKQNFPILEGVASGMFGSSGKYFETTKTYTIESTVIDIVASKPGYELSGNFVHVGKNQLFSYAKGAIGSNNGIKSMHRLTLNPFDGKEKSATHQDVTFHIVMTYYNYSITYNGMDGASFAETQPSTFNLGSPELTIGQPTKVGYTFAGWTIDSSSACTGASLINDNKNVTIANGSIGDLSLTANWIANEYTVTFDPNALGVINDTTSKTVTFDSPYGDLPVLTRTGYTFAGWYTDPLAGTQVNSETLVLTPENHTLYAHWNINQYTITFNSNGGSAVAPITQDYATAVTAPAEPTRVGYTFAGWYSDSTLETPYEFTTMPAENITLYANWVANEYIVTFDVNAEDAVTTIENKTVNYNAQYGELPFPTKVGYSFDGWFTSASAGTQVSSETIVSITENQTLYAHWSINEYTITFDSEEGSEVASITQNYGTAVTAPIEPTRDGYTFGGWYVEDTYETLYEFTTMPGENITLHAKWTANTYTITYEHYYNGGLLVDDIPVTNSNPTTYTCGTTITLKAPVKNGYDFAGWYTDDETTASKTYTIAAETFGDITLKAKWTLHQYKLTVYIRYCESDEKLKTLNGDQMKKLPLMTGYETQGYSGTSLFKTTQTYTIKSKYLNIVAYKLGYYILSKCWLETGSRTFKNNGWSRYTLNGQASSLAQYKLATFDKKSPSTSSTHFDVKLHFFVSEYPYTMTYNGMDGASFATTQPSTYKIISDDIIVSEPTKVGYTFTGWTIDDANLCTGATLINGGMNVSIPNGSTGNLSITANWEPNKYQVVFDPNALGVINDTTSKIVTFDEAYCDLPIPLRDGYTFDGWFTDETSGTKVTSTTIVKTPNDHTLYAHWNINQYTITFNSNGGSAVAPITQDYATAVTAPAEPTKEGYTFAGWYSDNTLETPYEFTTMPAENITLYAKWNAIEYTITYNLNGGSVEGNPDSYTIETESFTLVNPTRTGYTFLGWTGANGEENQTSVTQAKGEIGSKTYTANWVANDYIVTFDPNAVGVVNGTPSKTVTYNATYGELPVPTKEGYTFDGWYTQADGGTEITSISQVTNASNHSLYAHWTINQYTISFNSNGGNEVAPIMQDYASAVTAPAEPTRVGYTFAGWYSDSTLETPYEFTTMPAQNTTLYAKWNVVNYTVTYNYYVNGVKLDDVSAITNTNITSYTVETEDTTFKAISHADVGYRYDHVTINDVSYEELTEQMIAHGSIGNKVVNVYYVSNEYVVSFNYFGATDNTGVDSTFVLYLSEYGELPEPTKTGYSFLGWVDENDNIITSSSIYTLKQDSTLKAKWEANSYTVMFNKNGGDTVSLESKPITYDSQIGELPSATKEGYTFVGWFTEEDGGSEILSTTVYKNEGPTTYFAHWVVNTYKVTFDSNGGSSVASDNVEFGSLITKPANPTREGYSFRGWFLDDDTFVNEVDFETYLMGSANVEFHAKWSNNTILLKGGEGHYDFLVLMEREDSYEYDGETFVDTVFFRESYTQNSIVHGNETEGYAILGDILPMTSINAFLSKLDVEAKDVRIYDNEGVLVYENGQATEALNGYSSDVLDSGSEYAVGTGFKVELYINGEVQDTIILSVLGDIDGDGALQSNDYEKLRLFIRTGTIHSQALEVELASYIRNDGSYDRILTSDEYQELRNITKKIGTKTMDDFLTTRLTKSSLKSNGYEGKTQTGIQKARGYSITYVTKKKED